MYETCKDFRYKKQAVVKLYMEKYVYWKMGFKKQNDYIWVDKTVTAINSFF